MKYRIEKSDRGWNISQRKVAGKDSKTPGEVSYSPFKYYGTLEQAALGLLDILIHDKADTTDTAALIDAVHEAQAETKKVLIECLTK